MNKTDNTHRDLNIVHSVRAWANMGIDCKCCWKQYTNKGGNLVTRNFLRVGNREYTFAAFAKAFPYAS